MPHWEKYEEAAAWLLNQFAGHFGIDYVEGKQQIQGAVTSWEIDAKGVRTADGGIVVVECKCWKNSVPQDVVAGLAYRIKDMGASGGIVVSPSDLQAGSRSIATAEGIVEVKLGRDATPQSFALEFLGKFRAGGSMDMTITGSQ